MPGGTNPNFAQVYRLRFAATPPPAEPGILWIDESAVPAVTRVYDGATWAAVGGTGGGAGGLVTGVAAPLTLTNGTLDIAPATAQADGAMTAADKAALDALAAGGGSATYVHDQLQPATTWTIDHALGQWPAVTVVDSGGTVVVGEVAYLDSNRVKLSFAVAFGGRAFLNI